MKLLRYCVYILMGLLSVNALANDAESEMNSDAKKEPLARLGGVYGFGVDFGGQTLGTVQFQGGSSQQIKSHEGMYIYGGGEYWVADDLFARGTVGYKFDTVSASNGEADFSRVPFELIFFKAINKHHFGGGFSYHTFSTYSCEITNVCNFNIDIESALGWLVQYEYSLVVPHNNLESRIGIRYSAINYTPKTGGDTAQGNGIGVTFGFLF